MRIALAVAAGLLLAAASPPLGWAWAAVPAIVAFQWVLLTASRRGVALLAGAAFAAALVGSLVPWLANLAGVAAVGFVLVHIPHFVVYAWAVYASRSWPWVSRLALVAGGWVTIFFVLRWQPVLAVEWTDPGYTLAPWTFARRAAAVWGASGWGVIIGVVCAATAISLVTRSRRGLVIAAVTAVTAVGVGLVVDERPTGAPLAVTIVQGHPPCARVPCTSTREQIAANHLRLTADLEPGPDLVVWAESSLGFTTDPAQNPAVQDSVVEQAIRLDAHMLIGSDRPAGEVNFVNANLMIDPAGRIVGEYRKQHGVPFGEFVPWRSFFGRFPILARVPRDMIRGTGPVILPLGDAAVGSVISFEGSFGRYAREHAALGAQLLVVNTNQSSYGWGAASDQMIGFTTMRGAELGLDVVHAAISGRSTIINDTPGIRTPLYEDAVISGTVTLRDAPPTLYARWGDWLTAALLVGAGAIVAQQAIAGLTERRQPISTP